MRYADGSLVKIGDRLLLDEWHAEVEEVLEPEPGDPIHRWMQDSGMKPGIMVMTKEAGRVFYEAVSQEFLNAAVLSRAPLSK
ncbi:MAG: hypothetical protein IT548_16900 [Alphaproteobacteria bacterium]|nr:hypothetical protein [Alphaproteobacteria bacterium]